MNENTAQLLRVGALWQGAFPKSYWKHFNLLELPHDKVPTIKQKTVLKWMEGASEAPLLVVPFTAEGGQISTGELERLKGLLRLSTHSVLALHTTASFRPSRPNLDVLHATLTELHEQQIRVAWRADGLWSWEERDRIACATSAMLVVDPLDHELEEAEVSASPFYSILGRRGFQNQLSDYEIEKIHQTVANKPGFVSFGLAGFWSDALRFVGHHANQERFWDE